MKASVISVLTAGAAGAVVGLFVALACVDRCPRTSSLRRRRASRSANRKHSECHVRASLHRHKEVKEEDDDEEHNHNSSSDDEVDAKTHPQAHAISIKPPPSRRGVVPIFRVVVTGGPCSGKSTGMSYLREQLTACGFAVYCVPEVATILMMGGARLWLTEDERAREKAQVEQDEADQRALIACREAIAQLEKIHTATTATTTTTASLPNGATFTTAEEDPSMALTPKGSTYISPSKKMHQRVVLKLMLALEDNFRALAELSKKPTVMLYDRGTMDGSAYCTDTEWATIMQEMGHTTTVLRDARYDAVIHFLTAADGATDFYSLENNAIRHETVEEAAAQDVATRESWRGHTLMRIIDNSTGFDEKLERAANFLRQLTAPPPQKDDDVSVEDQQRCYRLTGYQHLPVVSASDLDGQRGLQRHVQLASVDWSRVPTSAICATITIIALVPLNHDHHRHEWLLRREEESLDGGVSYFHRVEVCATNNKKKKMMHDDDDVHVPAHFATHPIQRSHFLTLSERVDASVPIVTKSATYFLHKHTHLALLRFAQPAELAGRLTVVGPPSLRTDELPSWMSVGEESITTLAAAL